MPFLSAYFYSGMCLILQYILPQTMTSLAVKCSLSDIWLSRSVQDVDVENPWVCPSVIFSNIWPPESVDRNSFCHGHLSFYLMPWTLPPSCWKNRGGREAPFSWPSDVLAADGGWLMMNILFPCAAGSPCRRGKSTDSRAACWAPHPSESASGSTVLSF